MVFAGTGPAANFDCDGNCLVVVDCVRGGSAVEIVWCRWRNWSCSQL